MALGSLEIIVLIFVVIGLIKLIAVLGWRECWHRNVVKPVFGNPGVWGVIMGVLALVVLYYLLQTLTIVQIFGGVVFGSLLFGLAFIGYANELTNIVNKIYSKPFNSWLIFYMILWAVLCIWVLYAIF